MHTKMYVYILLKQSFFYIKISKVTILGIIILQKSRSNLRTFISMKDDEDDTILYEIFHITQIYRIDIFLIVTDLE